MSIRFGMIVLLLTASVALAQSAGPVVQAVARVDTSAPLYDLAVQALAVRQALEAPKPVKQTHGPLAPVGSVPLTAVAAASATVIDAGSLPVSPQVSAAPGAAWEGLGSGFPGYFVGVAPPDTTMAVGPSHVVQFVNLHIAIFDKFGVALLPGPGYIPGNAVWAGVGNQCEFRNDGDPMVQYDRLADRWVISQFQVSVQPYLQCVAVSTTNNPLGTYYRYTFSYANHGNDYPKLGIWPNAYFMTYNMFLDFGTFEGAWSCAWDRPKMLAGAPTTQICFTGLIDSIVPGDMDGPLPPPTNTNYQIQYRFYYGGTALTFIKFTPDFVTPANSTISGVLLPVPGTAGPCNNAPWACVSQPAAGSELLDSLGDRIMYRFAYSKRQNVESLVVNHSVDPDGAGPIQSAIRLYEIRNPSAAVPAMFQNITFVPDSHGRFMGSAAMDKMGNIMVGYSISSSTRHPSIGVTGRRGSTIRNRLEPETVVKLGTGSQLSYTANRWGDYSAMQIDPSNGCTFWYTQEYYAVNSVFNWRTHISSFKFPNCN